MKSSVAPPPGKPNSLALCAKSPTQYNSQKSPIVLWSLKGQGQRGFCGEKCEKCPPDWRESGAARVRLSGFLLSRNP
jgi:hypothetical protein